MRDLDLNGEGAPKNKGSSSVTDKLLNVATLGVLLLVAATLVRSWIKPAVNPGPDPIAVGSNIKALAMLAKDSSTFDVALIGAPKILYVFSTRCAACTAQKSEVAKWLATFDGGHVLTASTEAADTTKEYWSDSSGTKALPAPMRLTRSTAQAIRASYVPYFIVSDRSGVVQVSHVGPFKALDTAKVRRVLSAIDGNAAR